MTNSPTMLRKPVADRLQRTFLQNIRSGAWKPDQRIPAEFELARDHGASRSTVRTAIRELERAGLLSAIQGKGRVVTSEKREGGSMIGLISSGLDIREGAGFHIAEGMLARTGANGDHLATFAFSRSDGPMGERMKAYADLAGVVLLGPAFPVSELSSLIERIPAVAIARDERPHGMPSFLMDYGYHSLKATTLLLSRGHRHIVVTHGKKSYYDRVGANINQGAEWAGLLAGQDPSQFQFVDMNIRKEGGHELFHQLEAQANRPTAIISYGTWPVSGFIEAAQASQSWDISRMEFIVLNNLEDASLAERVAYFRCPYRQLAEDAASTLYEMIAGNTLKTLYYPYRGEMILPGSWKISNLPAATA
jgi:DNA-binding LacI/PurR family transcriptional regulator